MGEVEGGGGGDFVPEGGPVVEIESGERLVDETFGVGVEVGDVWNSALGKAEEVG